MTTASIVLSIARTGPRAAVPRPRIGRGYRRQATFDDAQWRNEHHR